MRDSAHWLNNECEDDYCETYSDYRTSTLEKIVPFIVLSFDLLRESMKKEVTYYLNVGRK